jgi:hypothetical protein
VNELTKLFDRIKNPEEMNKINKEELKSKIQNYSKIIKDDISELKMSGAVVSNLLVQYKDAGKKYKEEDFFEALKIIIEILKEKEKVEKEFLDKEIKKLGQRLDEIAQKYPVEKLKDEFSKAQSEFVSNNYKNSIPIVLDLRKQLAMTEKYHPKAEKLINVIEQKINKIKEAGYNIEEPMKLLSKMKEATDQKKYGELPQLKNDCLKAIEESRNEYTSLIASIKNAQEQIGKLSDKNLDIQDSNNLLKKAKRLLMSGDYSKAREITKECSELTEELLKKEKKD